MTIDELLRNLAYSRVTLFLVGDRLLYRAPEGALTADMRAAIAAYRPEIIKRLQVGQRGECAARKCITCDRRYWVDDPPKDGRIRTTCVKCGRFIGYRPEKL